MTKISAIIAGFGAMILSAGVAQADTYLRNPRGSIQSFDIDCPSASAASTWCAT